MNWLRTHFDRLWIRLFRPSYTKRIAFLEKTSSVLSIRYQTIVGHLTALEEDEKILLERGRNTTSLAARKKLASMLALLRKDMDRMRVLSGVVSRQLSTIGTQIHNASILAQCESVPLPDQQEMVQASVEAEEAVERLTDASSMDLSVSMTSSTDELEIMKEFEAFDKEKAEKAEKAEKTEKGKEDSDKPIPAKKKARLEDFT